MIDDDDNDDASADDADDAVVCDDDEEEDADPEEDDANAEGDDADADEDGDEDDDDDDLSDDDTSSYNSAGAVSSLTAADPAGLVGATATATVTNHATPPPSKSALRIPHYDFAKMRGQKKFLSFRRVGSSTMDKDGLVHFAIEGFDATNGKSHTKTFKCCAKHKIQIDVAALETESQDFAEVCVHESDVTLDVSGADYPVAYTRRILNIGDRVAVRFDVADGTDAWYKGSITRFGRRPMSRKLNDPTFVESAHVEFDDGEFMAVDLDDRVRLLPKQQ